LQELSDQSVGPSFGTYRYQGHQYALPIDAAAQVAAFRGDLLSKLGLRVPRTQSELRSFYKKIPKGYSVAWPMCATDLWCSFLTLCAQKSGRDFIKDFNIEMSAGVHALDELKYHLERLHPESLLWNPIQTLDRMSNTDEIIYAPYLFGYTNYARKEYAKNRITFGHSPVNPNLPISTILGGVGLAVSSKSNHAVLASAFVAYVAATGTQTKTYARNGGQPGNLEAWKSKANNELCNHFFEDTLETMEHAFVRPRHPSWNAFQEQGAELLHQGILKKVESQKLIKDLNFLYRSFNPDGTKAK